VPSYAQSFAPGFQDASTSQEVHTSMIAKSEDVTMADVIQHPMPELKPTLYTVYSSASDIPYAPEGALKEGLLMVETIKTNIKKLQLGSKLRQDVWMRELERSSASPIWSFPLSMFFLIVSRVKVPPRL
jgi:hypothetical protein